MAANFPNSTKTWTPLTNGTTTDVSHVNTLYDEVTAVENTLLSGTDKQILSNVNGVPTWTNASGESVNVETLTGDKTLTTSDAKYQILNPNGADRNIILPTGTTTKSIFYFRNTGSNKLTIKYNSTKITTVGMGHQVYEVIWNGTTWIYGNNAGKGIAIGDNANANMNDDTVAIGRNANGGHYQATAVGCNTVTSAYGTAFGYNANGNEGGVAIGANAQIPGFSAYCVTVGQGSSASGAYTAAAFGRAANAKNNGTAIGNNTNTNSQNHAIAKGYQSKCERWNEEWKCSDNVTANKYGYGTLNWYAETTTATPAEIFLGGTSNKRATVLANSAYTFSLLCIAYCNAGTKGKSIKIEGGIRRDGANNTVLIGTPTTTILSEDGTTNYTITVSADDTNETLKITVTGADTETVRWNVTGQISECRF